MKDDVCSFLHRLRILCLVLFVIALRCVLTSPQAEEAGEVSNLHAAKWLLQSTFVASSIETGRVGYVEAWGGDEFGYAYTYSLAGEPTGVSIDSETGILSVDTPIDKGLYKFEVVATNRGVVHGIVRFPIVLDVREGVRADRKAGEILSKSYYVDSGLFGKPIGQDFTNVLSKIHETIVKDQTRAGDGNLRATVYFRRGGSYDYTTNNWPAGIQYLMVAPDPDYNPTGPRPRLRNVRDHFVYDSEVAVLGTGGGSAFDEVPNALKLYSPRIDGTESGQDWVRLKDKSEASKIAQYLYAGEPLLVTTAQMDDVVDGSQYCVPMSFRTDGTWIWTEVSAYYAERHRLEPDLRLLAHIRANDYSAPEVDGVAVYRAVEILEQPAGVESAWILDSGSGAGSAETEPAGA